MNDEDILRGMLGTNMWGSSSGYGVKTHIDDSKLWGNDMYELRNIIANQVSNDMDMEVLKQLKAAMEKPKEKTKEDKVVDIVKGGFENHFGMSIQEFQEIYDQMVEDCPERLV